MKNKVKSKGYRAQEKRFPLNGGANSGAWSKEQYKKQTIVLK